MEPINAACDPVKREKVLQERGIDLFDMVPVFEDRQRIDFEDKRFAYGEERRLTIGNVGGTIFTVVYTMREPVTWLITAWRSNRKERELYESR